MTNPALDPWAHGLPDEPPDDFDEPYGEELDDPPTTAPAIDPLYLHRPWMRRLHDYAQARRIAPDALLGVTLARIVTAIPPHVVLPPLIGSVASLNLFVGLVGSSGSGKGTAEAAAGDFCDVGQIEIHTTGSGEGIAHAYMRREGRGKNTSVVQHTHAAMFSVPEVDTLTALGDRRGATLLPELRRAWSGERLGFAYADPTRRLPIPAHQYRLTLIVGIQPLRAGALLADSAGGTPQRFLWMSADDPNAPDHAPAAPDPMSWQPPELRPDHINPTYKARNGRIVLEVCDQARATIDHARLARLRGDGDALDGHLLLNRLKVAAALAAAESRLNVTDDDWHLAGHITARSTATRDRVAESLSRAAIDTNRVRAEAEAGRAVIVTERVADHGVTQCCRAVVRALRRTNDWTNRGDLNRTVSSRWRPDLDEALARLADTGQVDEQSSGTTTQYRLTQERP